MCQPHNITVEAELGILGKKREDFYTDPSAAAEFTSRTGIHALAVAIGNAHGFYDGDPKLDFDRLRDISERVPQPLVLHGGSGISDAHLQRAISLGISKINIYTEMSAAAASKMRAQVLDNMGHTDYPTMLSESREAVAKVVQDKLHTFGSAGKA
jgi:ketose-bisphosphate aldolase